ncbi:MAG: glycerate kinase [Rhodospirillaceae bacterium]|nr:glycerate kinase [Rhodospirillaceae bacterium]|tara:strand:+ start:163 stop:1449 length:1287 start_codon:yes stop_codon:yes gene_type:complete
MIIKEPGARALLRELFDAAIAAADPAICVPSRLPVPSDRGRVVIVGAGKASAAMARAVEDAARKEGWFERLEGVVVTRYAHGVPCERIGIVEAGHPVPDAAGAEAAQRILALVDELAEDDLLICLVSGGGSALLAAPAEGIGHKEKAEINRALLRSGAPIDEMNCVRKHLSAIKGGRLALRAFPARVVSLMISDVPGDDPSVIASGPTVPDPTTRHDALEILVRYGIDVPASVVSRLNNVSGETPKADDPVFRNVENVIVARPDEMLVAAEGAARQAGLAVMSLGANLEGEARDLGAAHAALARELQRSRADEVPILILSGGETTVTVTGDGRGGRNAEYALSLAAALAGASGIYAIACDTDGIDGVEDNAGVIVTPDSLERSAAAGFEAMDVLARNDAYSLFAAIGDLVVTGPTRTNVNDFRAILIT